MKHIVTVQDLSCFGKCSLTIALPVLSAMGVACSVLPTALLSTHTLFSDVFIKDLSDEMSAIKHRWSREQLSFDGFLTGYLSSKKQVEEVLSVLDTFHRKETLVVTDPAMGDHGHMYRGLPEDFPQEMKKIIGRADIITPNLTEGSLLTGLPYRETADKGYLHELLAALCELGPSTVILTGVQEKETTIGAVAYEKGNGMVASYQNDCLPYSYHGTGDLFAATLCGGLMNDLSLQHSIELASDLTRAAMEATKAIGGDPRHGIAFETQLPYLWKTLSEYRETEQK